MAPFIDEILVCNDLVGGTYAEPYAGGAGIAMELLLNNRVTDVHLNDSSVHIYSFWRSIVTQPEEFCRRIASASLSIEDWKLQREIMRHPELHDEMDLGFSTFYLNRCNRSGVLRGGVIGGLAQSGEWRMDARFPRSELVQRIEAIATKADHISVTNMDAEAFMGQHATDCLPSNSLIYCDPPYYERAQGLYLDSYRPDDHARLAGTIQGTLGHKWLVSYDGHPEIISLYRQRRHFMYDLQYSASRSYKGREVFIFSDDLCIPPTSVLPSLRGGLHAVAS